MSPFVSGAALHVRGALAAALLALPAAVVTAGAQAVDSARVTAVADSVAAAHLRAGTIPGLSIAVAHRGRVLLARGYGSADVEHGVPAGPETVFGITSISKQITAALVLRLAEQGRLSLDDVITRHLPDYPAHGHRVTLAHLLSHTSGLADMGGPNDGPDPQWTKRDPTYAEMMSAFGRQMPLAGPGERYEYNNFGYYLLGEIIAKVTGRRFADHADSTLKELGFGKTQVCDAQRIVPNRARPYDQERGRVVNARSFSVHVLGAAGNLCSTAPDLVRWAQSLHDGKVVSRQSLQRMTGPTVLSSGDTSRYGYGLQLSGLEGHRKHWHGGTWPWGGFLAHYPDAGLSVAVLTNGARAGRVAAEEIEEAIARAALRLPPRPPRAASLPSAPRDLPLSEGQRARYVGKYRMQMGEREVELRIFVEDRHLKAKVGSQEPTTLLSQGEDSFAPAASTRSRLVFTVSEDIAIAVAMQMPDGRIVRGTRIP